MMHRPDISPLNSHPALLFVLRLLHIELLLGFSSLVALGFQLLKAIHT
jgi:hypothetical protein